MNKVTKYPIDFNATLEKIIVYDHGSLRDLAAHYNLTATTVRRYIHKYTKENNLALYEKVCAVLNENKASRYTNLFRNKEYVVKNASDILYTKEEVLKIAEGIVKRCQRDIKINIDEYGDVFLFDDENFQYFMLIIKGIEK